MEALASRIVALVRLLSALPLSWSWTPARAPFSSVAHSYLNAAQRPLWILEDELMRRHSRHDADFITSTRAPLLRRSSRRMGRQQDGEPMATAITIRVRPEGAAEVPRATTPRPWRFPLPHSLQLPSHYVQQLSSPVPIKSSAGQPRPAQRRRQPQSLPIFDSVPGDNALPTASYPIFVYNGSKGELLLNTMLSAQRYPMQEPVPGQVLYPPSTPMFRPKPIVERMRLPGQRELLNLTLIPFYAHEAITVPPSTSSTTTTAATTTAAIMLAATPSEAYLADVAATVPATAAATGPTAPMEPLAETTPMPSPTSYETQLPRSKRKRKPKKVRQYSAYHSPQEVVQWQPTERSSPVLAAPDNHRHYMVATTEDTGQVQEDLEQLRAELELPTQELQLEEQPEEELQAEIEPDPEREPAPVVEPDTETEQTTAASSSSAFQIIYVDESMETPYDSVVSTTVAPPRQSSRYALRRQYYAFPVYTLGKLLRNPQPPDDYRDREQSMEEDCSGSCTENEDNTWFILNSRYRGPHRKHPGEHEVKYYTSKYVQNTPR